MTCKEGQFDVVELMINDQFKTFSINLNAQHVTGMTSFDLAVHIRYTRVTTETSKSLICQGNKLVDNLWLVLVCLHLWDKVKLFYLPQLLTMATIT